MVKTIIGTIIYILINIVVAIVLGSSIGSVMTIISGVVMIIGGVVYGFTMISTKLDLQRAETKEELWKLNNEIKMLKSALKENGVNFE